MICVYKSQKTASLTFRVKNQLYQHKGVKIPINKNLFLTAPTEIINDYRRPIWHKVSL